jgi:hypothetical protein
LRKNFSCFHCERNVLPKFFKYYVTEPTAKQQLSKNNQFNDF